MNFRLIKSLASGWLMMVTIIALSSCRHVSFGAESDIKTTVDSFACDYFNWHFEEAARLARPSRNAGYAMLHRMCIRQT